MEITGLKRAYLLKTGPNASRSKYVGTIQDIMIKKRQLRFKRDVWSPYVTLNSFFSTKTQVVKYKLIMKHQ